MEQLAADRSGKAFYNTNDLIAAMQHAIADGSHYYTIVDSQTNKKMEELSADPNQGAREEV